MTLSKFSFFFFFIIEKKKIFEIDFFFEKFWQIATFDGNFFNGIAENSYLKIIFSIFFKLEEII